MLEIFKPKPFFLLVAYLTIANTCKAQFALEGYITFPDAHIRGPVDSTVSETWLAQPNGDTIKSHHALRSRQMSVYDKSKRLTESYYWLFVPLPHSGLDLRPVKTIYTYDILGNLIGQLRFFTTGDPWTKDIYTISGNRVSAKSIYLPNNSSTSNTTEFVLNSLSKVIQATSIMNTGEVFSTSYYKFDAKGRMFEENTYRGDGSLMFQHLSTYDDKNNLIEDDNPHGDRQNHKYKYDDFDKMGNWRIKTEYSGSSAIEVTRRKIYYYN